MPFTHSSHQGCCLSSAVRSLASLSSGAPSSLAPPPRVPCSMVSEMVLCRVIGQTRRAFVISPLTTRVRAFQQGYPFVVSHIRFLHNKKSSQLLLQKCKHIYRRHSPKLSDSWLGRGHFFHVLQSLLNFNPIKYIA